MRSILFIFLVIFLFACRSQHRTRVIFFGDSITKAGVEPGGYIVWIDSLCKSQGLNDKYEFIGSGIIGDRIHNLSSRVENEVVKTKPAIVVIHVGVNDVWHHPPDTVRYNATKFENLYQGLIYRLRTKNVKIILCTLTTVGEKLDANTRGLEGIDLYSDIIRNIAARNNLSLVDLRKAFLNYYRNNNPANQDSGILTLDRVHLNSKGHQLVGDEIWKVMKR